MASFKLNATQGTGLFLIPGEYGISICVESSGAPCEPPSNMDILLTNCDGGMKLSVVPAGTSSQGHKDFPALCTDYPSIVPYSSNMEELCTSSVVSNHFDIMSLNSFTSHHDPMYGAMNIPSSMDRDAMASGSSSSGASLPFEKMDLMSHDSFLDSATTPSECAMIEGPKSQASESERSSPCPSISETSSSRSRSNVVLHCRRTGCKKTFKKEHTRNRHEVAHVDIFCTFPNCGTKFKRNHDRMRHEYIRHGKAMNLCRRCNKTFLSAQNLEKHCCSLPRDCGGVS